MTLHVVALPHTKIRKDYGQCAYTQKLVKFRQMFPDATLYANQGSEGNVVQIYSEEDLQRHFGEFDWYQKGEIYKVDYNPSLAYWREFNRKVIEEMEQRIAPRDLILLIAGQAQEEIADAFPNHISVEFGVGYEGVFSRFRVFESYAWMHHIYGLTQQKNGGFFDAVIPNYFDVADFPFSDTKDDYLLFMGRPVERKGIEIVRELGKRGHRIIAAGIEKFEGENIEWVGYADSKKRGKLMSRAKAMLVPTLYIGPFEGVNVEAQLCGTPVISTDFGAFHETVEQGRTGYRCKMLHHFIEATNMVHGLDYHYIRDRATKLYALESIKRQYEDYFDQLFTLWGKGWYQTD